MGSQIARVLVETGQSPIVFDRSPQPAALADIVDTSRASVVQGDVLKPWDLAAALSKGNIEGIIHTAAYPMLTSGAQSRPHDAIEVNVMGTTNVLEAAVAFGIPKVVVVSSAVLTYSMDGGADGGDLGREEASPRPMTFYAATKQAVEGIALNYARWRGVDVRVVRYAAVAGPCRTWRRRTDEHVPRDGRRGDPAREDEQRAGKYFSDFCLRMLLTEHWGAAALWRTCTKSEFEAE